VRTGFLFIIIGMLLSGGAFAAPPAFRYEDLVAVIQAKGLRSVEQVLPYLPASMKSNFTLVRQSASLQKSDDLHPRVILFGADAQLTCAFGGNPQLVGYDSLECYQYRAQERRFDFYEILFPSAENGIQEPAFSEKNRQAFGPFQCTSCHTDDPRPNWEPYSIWKPVFGSQDDGFKSSSKEKDSFRQFKAVVQHSPRYSQLIFAKEPLAPYRESFANVDLRLRPNFRFTYHVTQLTAQRNTRLLQEQGSRVSWLFLRRVAGCPGAVRENVLENLFTLQDWTPAFLSLNPNCQDCLAGGYKDSDLSHYRYNSGKGYLEEAVAYLLLKDLVEAKRVSAEVLKKSLAADDDSYADLGTPVAPSIEPYKLRKYCRVFDQKL
jgi:hypothetical protein